MTGARTRVVVLVLLASAVPVPDFAGAGALAAQQPHAWVVPRGMIEVEAAGRYTYWDRRARLPGEPGTGAVALGEPFRVRLGPDRLPSLAALQSALNAAFEATEETGEHPGFRATAEHVQFGDTDLAYSRDRVEVPLGVALGVAPRVSVSVRTTVAEQRAAVHRFGLLGGAVGRNPNAFHNQSVLAQIDPTLGPLGSGAWLPTRGSAAGDALQARVRAATTDSLQLPERSATVAQLDSLLSAEEFRVPPLQGEDPWRLGAVELGARVQLIDGLRGAYVAAGSGAALRAALEVHARIPTGEVPRLLSPLVAPPEHTHGGYGARLDVDAFFGTRIWATISGGYAARADADVETLALTPQLLFEPAAPRRITRSPGDVVSIDVLPRVRFGRALAVELRYSRLQIGEERYSGIDADEPVATLFDLPARSLQRLGGGLRYTTLPAHAAGLRVVPLEAYFHVTTTLAPDAGTPAERRFELHGSVYHRLW